MCGDLGVTLEVEFKHPVTAKERQTTGVFKASVAEADENQVVRSEGGNRMADKNA